MFTKDCIVCWCGWQVGSSGQRENSDLGEEDVGVHILKTPMVGLEGVGAMLGSLYPKSLEHHAVLLTVKAQTQVGVLACANATDA